METVRVYELDSYQKELVAKILRVEESKAHLILILDKTIFYPEGGGQPCDKGEIKINDRWIPVENVQKKDKEIYHYLRKEDSVIPHVGIEVCLRIDWNRRFEYMKWHSGEHLFSGIIQRLYQGNNIGFHIGKDAITCDYDIVLSDEEIEILYTRVNAIIQDNVEIKSWYLAPGEDVSYRSKKEIDGQIRLTSIEEYDTCACCGTHVGRTGEIGPLYILSREKFKDGMRFQILFGKSGSKRIYEDYRGYKEIGQIFSTSPDKIKGCIYKLQEELGHLKAECSQLEQCLIKQILESNQERESFYYKKEYNSSFVFKLGEQLSKGQKAVLILGGEQPYYYCLVGEMAEEKHRLLKGSLNIKGGGRDGIYRGQIQNSLEEVRKVWDRIYV